jgi:hypothetical protein
LVFYLSTASFFSVCDWQVTQYEYKLQLQRYALIPIVIFWVLVEGIRIRFGMSGNLREKVPDLLTYLLISVFPQLPLVLYLAFFQEICFPVDPVMGVIMLLVLVSPCLQNSNCLWSEEGNILCFFYIFYISHVALTFYFCLMKVIQFVLGYSTLQQLIRTQTAQFLRLCDREEY